MTAHLSPAQAPASRGPREDPHRSLHSETGPRPAEHPGRPKNPLIKVPGLAWLEFEKPDLEAAERFGADFGFAVADRTPETLLLRGRWAGPACLVVRRGPHFRFAGTAYQAAARDDLDRLARGTGGTVSAHPGGHVVVLRDPSGFPVRVVHGVPDFPALPDGQVRQDSTVADMIVRPAQALTLLSRFQPMAPGDLLLTGTPGGTALKAPAKAAGKLAGLLLPATRWRLFFQQEAHNPRYLRDGDVIAATIASADGQLNLGTQRNTVVGKTP